MNNKQLTVSRFLYCFDDLKNNNPLVISIGTTNGYNITYTVKYIECINNEIILSNKKNYFKNNISIGDILDHISKYDKNNKIKLEVYDTENSIDSDPIISMRLLDNASIINEKYCTLIKI